MASSESTRSNNVSLSSFPSSSSSSVTNSAFARSHMMLLPGTHPITTQSTETSPWTDFDNLKVPDTILPNPVRPDAVPWPGNTYKIIDEAHGRPMCLVNGKLELQADTTQKESCHWACIENNGWLGFRNTVSGTFLGHDGAKNMHAVERHHRGWEYLIARGCPDGGYYLLTMHWEQLLKVTVGIDGKGLVAREGEGVVWEFVKV